MYQNQFLSGKLQWGIPWNERIIGRDNIGHLNSSNAIPTNAKGHVMNITSVIQTELGYSDCACDRVRCSGSPYDNPDTVTLAMSFFPLKNPSSGTNPNAAHAHIRYIAVWLTFGHDLIMIRCRYKLRAHR